MQKLEVNTSGGYVNYLKYLWEITSQDVFPSEVEVPNEGWIDLINTIWKICHFKEPNININPFLLEEYRQEGKTYNTDVLVGCSGGKDSLEVALTLQEYGYTPILMHIRGLTQSNKRRELMSVKDIAEEAGWPLIVEDFHYSGDNPYIESPVRNFLVLAYMIEYMLDNNINKAGFGLLLVDKLIDTPIEEHYDNGISDGIDVMQLFVKAVRYTFKDFTLMSSINSKPPMLIWLYRKYRKLYDLSTSCFCIDNYFNYKREKYKKKFGFEYLPKYNCFCCRKCVQDYLLLKEAGIEDWNASNSEGATSHAKSVMRESMKRLNMHNIPENPLELMFEGYKEEIKQPFDTDWKPDLYRIEPETICYLKGRVYKRE